MALEKRLGLKDNERLLAVVRRAPVTLVPGAFVILLLLLAPFFFLVILLRWETLGSIIIGMLIGLGLFFGIRFFLKWRLSIFAITEHRLISVKQGGYLDRHVTELPFSKVHDVAYRIKGLFPTVFRYGTVMIESAGSEDPLEIEMIKRPAVLQSLLIELQERSVDGRDDFGNMLHAISDLETRELQLLQAEIRRSLKRRPDMPK